MLSLEQARELVVMAASPPGTRSLVKCAPQAGIRIEKERL